jgi:Fe-S-cluster containining protein
VDPKPKQVSIRIELTVADRTIEAEAGIPDVPIRTTDLLPILRSFSDGLIGISSAIVEEQDKRVSCRAGCGACCRQLVPISEPEAWAIAELVEAMPPERKAAVLGRFQQTLKQLEESGLLAPLTDRTSLKSLEARRKIGVDYFGLGTACPFLENESCSIYDERPMSCREYLVTSPAEKCKNPGPGIIEIVPLTRKFSETLYVFGDGVGRETTRWVPLILALDWVGHQKVPAPLFQGPQLFKNFVAVLTEPESGGALPGSLDR